MKICDVVDVERIRQILFDEWVIKGFEKPASEIAQSISKTILMICLVITSFGIFWVLK